MIRPLFLGIVVAACAAPVLAQAPAVSTCNRDAGKGVIAPLLTSCGTGRTLLTINGRRLENDPAGLSAPAVIEPRDSMGVRPPAPKQGLAGTRDLLFRDTDPQPRFDQEPAQSEPAVRTNEPNVRPENRGGFQRIEKASATAGTPAVGGKNGPERDAEFMRNRAKGQDDRLPLEIVGKDELLTPSSPSVEEIARSLNEVGHVDVSTINHRNLGKGQVLPIPLNRTAPTAPVKVEETGK